jgi:hypothetical protein
MALYMIKFTFTFVDVRFEPYLGYCPLRLFLFFFLLPGNFGLGGGGAKGL